MPNIENSILQEIHFSQIKRKDISLFIKREDLIHSEISGNKYRKLKYNLLEAKKLKKSTLLTFGGAFSNHILATSVAGKLSRFKTIGIVRGEELGKNLKETLENNKTLKQAHQNGMKLHFVSRQEYRQKNTIRFLEKLKDKFGDFYLIPEGGTNCLAVRGCQEILSLETKKFDVICISVGTGGTISGIINSAKNHQKVIGFPALKGDFLNDEIKKYTLQHNNWELITNYHFGGYAKTSDELISFINQFKKETNVPLDPIYTGKMVFGVVNLIKNNYFAVGSKILMIHTGGIQGVKGMNAILKRKNSLTIV